MCDTVWCDETAKAMTALKPDIIVLNASVLRIASAALIVAGIVGLKFAAK